MNNGELVLKNSIVYNNGTDFNSCSVFENDPTNSTNLSNPNHGYGVVIYSGYNDVSLLDSWFESVNYIGAVDEDWLQNWTK